jgi:two-component system, chemotaxis family, chemotaxis protein CheY
MATILVVDDDRYVRSFVRQLLEDSGHDVLEAFDGNAGIAAYREHRPDLVVTDVFMPEQGGLGLIREIRGKHGDVKIIAMSGGSALLAGDFLDYAGKFGASALVRKPFSAEGFLGVVAEVLARRPAVSS